MRAREIRQGLITVALVLLICWLGYLIWGLAGKATIAWTEARQTRAQYTSLETRKRELQANIDALNTPRGQDAAMREAFGVARPGETVIVVVPPSTATTTPQQSWWQQLFNWL